MTSTSTPSPPYEQVPDTAHNVFCSECGEFLFTCAHRMDVAALCEKCGGLDLVSREIDSWDQRDKRSWGDKTYPTDF